MFVIRFSIHSATLRCWCHGKWEMMGTERRLNGFISENDNKCCKLSHFFPAPRLPSPLLLFASQLADSLSLQSTRWNARGWRMKEEQKIVQISKGNSQCHEGVLRLIEMLYIFHSTCPICVSYILCRDMCRHWKRRLAYLLVVPEFY